MKKRFIRESGISGIMEPSQMSIAKVLNSYFIIDTDTIPKKRGYRIVTAADRKHDKPECAMFWSNACKVWAQIGCPDSKWDDIAIYIVPDDFEFESKSKPKPKVIYIAGGITGVENYREKFAEAQKAIEDMGAIVLNPCILPAGMEYEQYMTICFGMVDACDAVFMTEGWQNSRGASKEEVQAKIIGKRVAYSNSEIEEIIREN